MKNLNFKINNIGSINNADLDLGKINIISGVNGSGKTTSSKILYSYLVSNTSEGIDFHNRYIVNLFDKLLRFLHINIEPKIEDKLNDENNNDIFRKLRYIAEIFRNYYFFDDFDEIYMILEEIENEVEKKLNSKRFNALFNNLKNNLSMVENTNKRINFIFHKLLNNEFNEDFNFNDSSYLIFNDNKFSFPLNESNTNGNFNNFHVNDIFYIETPYILDFNNKKPINNRNSDLLFHQESLINNLYSSNSNKSDELYFDIPNINENTLKKINNIINGNIYYDDEQRSFIYTSDIGYQCNIKNTAAGIKTIGILQRLLSNELDTNSFIIMDEPEVHLHPSWQLKLAEIIVLLSCENNINFYINSHSPQFIEAIEVYSRKYGLENDTNFYFTKIHENSYQYDFIKVEKQNLHLLYKDLSGSYSIIDELSGKFLADDF
ncbi:MAG: ATP-binding protein [Methanobrevibacter sp.]|jgi:predicted ATPase|nr:ATP-binding protein [Candidatus Methanoflexus mossambicus]